MDDILEIEPRRRNLDEEEDLEMMIDHDQAHEDKELKSRVIFAIQGLGAVRTILRNGQTLEAYITGTHCEQSIKDLVKLIRNESPLLPKTRIILANYNIVESDLIELLILQVEDKKLSFWVIALLSLLTSKVNEESSWEDKIVVNSSLQEYKNSFVKHECMGILVLHIADYFKTPEESRMKAHFQMLEFIVVLLRNLLRIGNSVNMPELHSKFLVTFLKEEVLNALLYLIQTEKGAIMQKIDIPILEILYYTFTCFNPAKLYCLKKQAGSKTYVMPRGPSCTRHSKFMPNFSQNTSFGLRRVVHSLERKTDNILANFQHTQPVKRKEMLKIEQLHQSYLQDNYLEVDAEGRKIGEIVFELAREFIQVELEQVVALLFDNIYRHVAKVNQENIVQYMLLCSWALEVARARFHHECLTAAKGEPVQFCLAFIAPIMQVSHFELTYKLLFTEATREKKKQFRINTFRAGLSLFKQYLDVVADNANSFTPADRRNANALMANMFRHDIARILRKGFEHFNQENVLTLLILITHNFFKLLRVYASGKTLTIQTNKLLKRKKNNRQEEKEQEIEEELVVEQEQLRFQERKYNEKSEFAIIADYEVISKFLRFLKEERFMTNSFELNEAIFYYIGQVRALLNGEWLFYQADTLSVFQEVICHPQFRQTNKVQVALLQDICKGFLKVLNRNKLALVQSLFRYVSISQKDNILQNYEGESGEVEMRKAGQEDGNLFALDQ